MRDSQLVQFFDDEHAYDDMNTCCECGWSWASKESHGEHLVDALTARYTLIPKTM
jgi:hypothetical protein